MKLLRFRRHGSWSEHLAALADGTIEPAARERLEVHLAGCGRCRQELADLRALRTALQRLPDLEVPRSFRLTPALLTATDPLESRRPSRVVRAATIGTRLTAGVAAAALAAVFIIDLGLDDGAGGDSDASRAADSGPVAEIAIASDATAAGPKVEGTPGGEVAPAATGTAESQAQPTAPPYDSTPAAGSAAPGETPVPATGPGVEDTLSPDEAPGGRQLFSDDQQPESGMADTAFSALEAEDDGGSREQVLRGLQVALAALLAASLGATLLLRGQARRRA